MKISFFSLKKVATTVALSVAVSVTISTASAQKAPAWLSAGWYLEDAEYFDQYAVMIDGKTNTIMYKVEDEIKSANITDINLVSNTALFGKKEGTISYRVGGKEYTVKFFDEDGG